MFVTGFREFNENWSVTLLDLDGTILGGTFIFSSTARLKTKEIKFVHFVKKQTHQEQVIAPPPLLPTHSHVCVCCTWFINHHDTSIGRYGNLLWFVFCCSCQFTRILHVIVRGYCVHFIMVIGRGMSIVASDTIDHTALIVSMHHNKKIQDI